MAFLQTSAIHSAVKTKTHAFVARMGVSYLNVDPYSIAADDSILHYQARVHGLLGTDRKKLKVTYPIEQQLSFRSKTGTSRRDRVTIDEARGEGEAVGTFSD
jgi:hypothetical protein